MAGTWKHGNALKIIGDGKGKYMNISSLTVLAKASINDHGFLLEK